MTEEPKPLKIIHAGRIQESKKVHYLLLKRKDTHHYVWFEETPEGNEQETAVLGATIEEAIKKASQHWKAKSFRLLNCGFRYTLPERDEHGYNAFFHQMAASYATPTGVYFDEEAGNNCFVNFASQEARDLLHLLKSKKRL